MSQTARERSSATRSMFTDGRLDTVGSGHGILVLPHTNDRPSLSTQEVVRLAISLHIARELLEPPLTVVCREVPVLAAPVPEAAVDEDSDLRGSEHDVDAAAGMAGNDRDVQSVPEATTVELLSKDDLRLCVSRALLLHATTDVLVGRLGS